MTSTVKAGPTKQFFVNMLTRDIDLKDAILDLLDNCIDGILRENKKKKKKKVDSNKPYSGYWAKITATPSKFEIVDNCGGIPREIAEESAFMLGRPSLELDSDIESVGMYGIGMKRAIFKMGKKCTVKTKNNSEGYVVTISPNWLEEEDNWELPLRENDSELNEHGTQITITQLNKGIKKQFDKTKSTLLSDLRSEISHLYAVIIEKGFRVYVNKTEIKPASIMLLGPKKKGSLANAIAPYAFKGEIDGVRIELYVGFYRKLASERELEREMEGRRSKDDAGWTIVCNDRAVVHKDKTSLTGWGTANVPKYHNQFISIAGVVYFRSNNSLALPLNTTKRGIDAGSDIYLFVLDIMREGVKRFTDFTNRWKKREDETNTDFGKTSAMKPNEIIGYIPKNSWTNVRKVGNRGTAKKYNPDLPLPKVGSANVRIVYTKSRASVKLVSEYIFDHSDENPSIVGEECFDYFLKEAKNGR